ncbi:protoporphyrinogen oxidase [Paenibacillus humicola]|uniref:protoporphyrinogen oxidase n=1 Tax=Paenibacillus humicola TaxID=3110540 RepID=UPI00237B8980|nr:protoporphyrinogen oxidase [Paenibacillus humicola]
MLRRSGKPDRLVVIGGGISGLSSAFYLLREAEARGRKAIVTIVDASPRLGGKIDTLRRDGFIIERGPDSFLTRKTPTIELARELGIEHELVAQNPSGKKSFILHRGKLYPMPPGLVLGIPTEIMPFARTGLLSWGAKLRALLDFVLPARKETGDESLGDFLSRRLGPEVMERVAEPLLAGIYAGDLSKLSLQATFPQFAQAERKYGSLIRGMRASRRSAPPVPEVLKGLPDSLRASMFLSFRGGLSTLVEALRGSLDRSGTDWKLGVKAVAIERVSAGDGRRSGGGLQIRPDGISAEPGAASEAAVIEADAGTAAEAEAGAPYLVKLSNGETIAADGIVVTAPAYAAAELLAPHADAAALRAVRYVSVANVVLAFHQSTLAARFGGSGFVIPRSEGTTITACTWTSVKWLHTSPDDKVLIRCYVGRAGDEAAVDLPDDQLIAAVRGDIRSTMGITAEPLFVEVTRLPRSMPQYPVGHVQQTSALRRELAAKLPGVWATGAAFDGVGLPDCIRQGRQAAAKIYETLGQETSS